MRVDSPLLGRGGTEVGGILEVKGGDDIWVARS